MSGTDSKNTLLPQTFSINCAGKLWTLEKPAVMGVLNMTDDSFYSGSRYSNEKQLLEKADQMLTEGAAILDLGGQSTRPRARRLSAAAEREKTVPVIRSILRHFPGTLLSIDTFYAEVARAAVEAGASVVNDISAGNMDPDMIPAVAALGVPYIAMHMQGTPETMQEAPHYDDVVDEVLGFFIARTAACRESGIRDIIIDPGFGFGKTVAHNYALLKHLDDLKMLGMPVVAGLSRKSMICRVLGCRPEEALNGTTALHMLALRQGAHILRAHDVKEATEVIRLWEAYQSST